MQMHDTHTQGNQLKKKKIHTHTHTHYLSKDLLSKVCFYLFVIVFTIEGRN